MAARLTDVLGEPEHRGESPTTAHTSLLMQTRGVPVAKVRKNTPDIVAHLPGVKAAVRAAAEDIANKTRANLASHHHDGDATIETNRGRTDAFVSLVDDGEHGNAMAIEFGHYSDKGEADAKITYVPGLRVLRDAADH